MARPAKRIYQLRIDLKRAKPPIWRRFLVVNMVTLAEFHTLLQIVMGWDNCHLHQFESDGNYYGTPDPEFSYDEILDEEKYKLHQLLKHEKDALNYEYDFGDNWEHRILLEKILPYDANTAIPRVIKAKGACPPEDVGGIWGYYDFLEAMNDPAHPEHDDYVDWLGGDFDPAAYDMEQVNRWLATYYGRIAR